MHSKKLGFTLAEVLITLAIIGVVAAMTIPSLMQSTQKQEYVSALKKEYATFSQAYNLMLADNGGDVTSLITGTADVDDANFMNEFVKYLKVQKNCGTGMECWYSTPRNWLNGSQQTSNLDSYWGSQYGKAILADGSMIVLDILNSSCSQTSGTSTLKICGSIVIDVNGAKGPNTLGRDFFWFWITKTGIYPNGIDNDTYSCDASTALWATNRGCAGKVLTEGAMNY